MNSTLRFGSTLTALALVLGGCAMTHAPKTAGLFDTRVDTSNIGVATKALAALDANHPTEAVALAERAVANSPTDAGFRSLLGNCYFAAGRFASAEAAYRDSLTLLSNQPQVVLKIALVSVAQGKNAQAIAFLDAAKNALDPADYGLALTLAGQPQQAADILQNAAQQVGADSRVRQNLALALAFSGDWVGARNIAAQDIPGDQLDARIQSWMLLAKPVHASDQVASLTGIRPAAIDPGQPVRLALQTGGARLAAVALAAVAAPAKVAEAAPIEVVEPTPAASPVAIEAATAAPLVVGPAPMSTPAPIAFAPVNEASLGSHSRSPRPSLSPRAASLTQSLYRHASLSTAQRSRTVVQLGAYSSRSSVGAAWNHVSAKFGSLRGYAPVAARFDGERGTVYRLSVQGFDSARQAASLCGALKRSGGSCFVRNVAGDTPVQVASR